jgi:hypothetical protein
VKIGNDLCFDFLVKWHDDASPKYYFASLLSQSMCRRKD